MSRTHLRALEVVTATALLAVLVMSIVPAGAAQTNNSTDISDVAPYYEDNSTSEVRNESWMANRQSPTLDNTTHYLTRVGGFVIGSAPAQGGVGPAGIMLLSLTLFGAFIGAGEGRTLGPIGGSVLAVVLASSVATIGLAPHWIYAVMVFALGLVLAAVSMRLFR